MTSGQNSDRAKQPAGSMWQARGCYVSSLAGTSLAGPLLLPANGDPRQAWLAWTGLNLLSSSPKATKRTRIAFTVSLLPLSDTFFFLPRHQPTQPLSPKSDHDAVTPCTNRPTTTRSSTTERHSLASSAKMWIINWCMCFLRPQPPGKLADTKDASPQSTTSSRRSACSTSTPSYCSSASTTPERRRCCTC